MKVLSSVSRVSVIAFVWLLLASGAFANVITPWLPLAAAVDQGHRLLLRARVVMVDGTSRAITIQGVGCTENICSRVRATTLMADSVWLDGLASGRVISRHQWSSEGCLYIQEWHGASRLRRANEPRARQTRLLWTNRETGPWKTPPESTSNKPLVGVVASLAGLLTGKPYVVHGPDEFKEIFELAEAEKPLEL